MANPFITSDSVSRRRMSSMVEWARMLTWAPEAFRGWFLVITRRFPVSQAWRMIAERVEPSRAATARGLEISSSTTSSRGSVLSPATAAISPSPEAKPPQVRSRAQTSSTRSNTRATWRRVVPFRALDVLPTRIAFSLAGWAEPSAIA